MSYISAEDRGQPALLPGIPAIELLQRARTANFFLLCDRYHRKFVLGPSCSRYGWGTVNMAPSVPELWQADGPDANYTGQQRAC
jgi:hypothetical protein